MSRATVEMAETERLDPLADLCIPVGEARFEPKTYVDLANDVDNASLSGLLKSTDAHRRLQTVADACLRNTGTALEDAAKEDMDAIQAFKGLMETGESELLAVEKAVRAAGELIEAEKKRYLDLIDRTITLQRECHDDPVKCWIYIGRDSESNAVFKMAPIHVRYFSIWNNKKPGKPNTLVMAPPRHAKTTSMRGNIVYKIGHDPELRCLILKDAKTKAQAEVNLLKSILRHPRFRALFPDVRVLDRAESGRDTNLQFTVSRVNVFSREPTIEGAAIQSRINGNGYDYISADDLCPPDVRDQPAVRRDANTRWEAVIKERMRLSPKNQIDLICTPWHEDDVSGRIRRRVEEGQFRDWTVAIDEFAIKDDANGHAVPVWDCIGTEELEQKKLMGDLYTLNYRLRAQLKKDKPVQKLCFYNSDLKSEWTTDDDRLLMKILSDATGQKTLSIDPTATAGMRSSDHGVIEGILTTKRYGYITNVWAVHMGPVPMQDWIVDKIMDAVSKDFPYTYVLIEAQGAIKGMVTTWIDAIQKMLKEKDCPSIPQFIAAGIRHGMTGQNPSKLRRLKESAAYIERGLVRFAGERRLNRKNSQTYCAQIANSEIDLLRDRIVNFNPDQRTDAIDATTQWVLYNHRNFRNPYLVDKKPVEATAPRCQLAALMSKQIKEDKEKWKRRKVGGGEELFPDEFVESLRERAIA